VSSLHDRPEVGQLELHHVGIIVRDLETSIQTYRSMGLDAPERSRIEDQQVELATFSTGTGYVELVSPFVEEGGLVRYLESRGESVHHVAYRVNDIQAELDRLDSAGFELIDLSPRIGAHGWKVAFIHPKSCHGVLTELVEIPD
jgi:methylmalonyl-CoA/ethylmalonyl-CoA epimerase